MDELEKGLDISVCETLRQEAIAKYSDQIKKWDVAMPQVEPLVLDFGLDDFYKFGLIEYWIANEVGAGYCGKYLFVFDGQACLMHYHKQKHETFFVVKGRIRMDYDGKSFEMKAGDVLPVEYNKLHGFTGTGPALLLEISKPCIIEDNYFQKPQSNASEE